MSFWEADWVKQSQSTDAVVFSAPQVNPTLSVDSPPNIEPHPPQSEEVRKPGYKRIGSAVFPRGSGGPPGKYHYKDIYFNSSNPSPFPSRSRPVDDQQVSKRKCIPLLDIRLHSPPLEDARKNGCRRIGSAGFPPGSGGPSGNYHYKITFVHLIIFQSFVRKLDCIALFV